MVDKFESVANLELVEDCCQMMSDGSFADEKTFTYFFVLQSLIHQTCNLTLTLGQKTQRSRGVIVGLVGACDQRRQRRTVQPDFVAFINFLYRPTQFFRRLVLSDNPTCAMPDNLRGGGRLQVFPYQDQELRRCASKIADYFKVLCVIISQGEQNDVRR